MTSDRAQAYGRVVKAVDELHLTAEEKAVIRQAADAMLFAEEVEPGGEARESLQELRDLFDTLVDAERISPDTGGSLLADVEDCGPLAAPVA